jgi:putative lipoprotein
MTFFMEKGMRNLGLYALGALVVLAGCSKAPTPPPAAPVAPIANSVSGTVALKDPHDLSNDAKVDLRVVDVTQTATPVAQISIPNASHPPIAFNLPIDPHAIDPKRTYSLEVTLTDGGRRYLPVLQYPVLTNRAPASNIAVVVAPEATPSEKLYEAFNRAYAQVGSMIHFNGSSQDDSSSTAWDAFASNGKVKFVREITDLDNDKGRISTRIAFQNDKPWVVVREESTGGNAKPFATTRVGWDDNGNLVLKDRIANGQTSDVSDADAKQLYDHAVKEFGATSNRVPKAH